MIYVKVILESFKMEEFMVGVDLIIYNKNFMRVYSVLTIIMSI